jgi:hypothetical protein
VNLIKEIERDFDVDERLDLRVWQATGALALEWWLDDYQVAMASIIQRGSSIEWFNFYIDPDHRSDEAAYDPPIYESAVRFSIAYRGRVTAGSGNPEDEAYKKSGFVDDGEGSLVLDRARAQEWLDSR